MRQFRSRTLAFRSVAAVLLAVFLHGCQRWAEVPSPRNLVSTPEKVVRLTVVGERTRLTVKNQTIVGDSIVWNEPQRGSVPISHVTFLEARNTDAVATGFFILVGVVAVLVIGVRNSN